MRRLLRPQVPTTPSARPNIQGQAVVPRGLGPSDIAPSQAPGLMAEQGTPILLPGFNFPPAGAIPVDVLGDANLAPGAVATILTVQVPNQLHYRIAAIGFGADDEAALGFLTWSILINSNPAPSYFGQTSAVGTIVQPSPIVVNADASALVEVVATIDATAAVTYRYIVRTQGWFYVEKGTR